MAEAPLSKQPVPSPLSSSASAPLPSATESCRKNKSDGASFLQDVRDHIDEFVHASMDEHKNCFHKTMGKMFGLTKAVGPPASPVESVLPLRVTTTDS